MKRIIAFILAAIVLCCTFASCKVYYSLFGIDESYTGPLVYAYLSDPPTTFDPLYAYLDESASFVMSLIYEGLYKLDANGKVVNGLASGYKKTLWDKERGEFQIEITIKDTMWNDQTAVSADQFVYAWRRIIDPGTSSPAAVLLYDIKNARKVANAEDYLTKFDFGATAVGTNILRIDLETFRLEDGSYKEPDLDAFITKLASPVLVPLRSDMVTKLDDWASSNATVPSCGPFFLKSFTIDKEQIDTVGVMRFERNRFYLRDRELDPINKYVKPYGVIVSLANRDGYFDANDAAHPYKWDADSVRESAAIRALEKYTKGELDYLSYIPLASRSSYADVKTNDSLYTHTYLFNTNNPLFKDPKVRQALSLVIDRDAIAKELVYATPATSIVSDKAFEVGYYTKKGSSFNSNSENHPYVQTTTSDTLINQAKELLKGVQKGSFTITVKKGDEVSLKVAQYCRDAWNKLGYSVSIRELGVENYKQNAYDGRIDLFNECYKANGESVTVERWVDEMQEKVYTEKSKLQTYEIEGFDVIAIDLYQNSADAFTVLAPYSKYFSGGLIDLSVEQDDEYIPVLPVTSYDNDEYNRLIEEAYGAPNASSRASALHAAESILMNDLPVMPIFSFRSPVLVTSNIKKITYGYGSEPIFVNLKYKNYKEEESK